MTAEIDYHRARQKTGLHRQLSHTQDIRAHVQHDHLEYMSDYQQKQILGWLEKYEDILHANIGDLE